MRGIVVLGVVLAALIAAAPVHANFPASIDTTVPPGGDATVSSPSLPPDMKAATVDVAPATPAEDPFFKNLRLVLTNAPTPGKRLMTCIALYGAFTGAMFPTGRISFDSPPNVFALLALSACLEVMRDVNAGRVTRTARAAASGCPRTGVQMPATFTRVGKKYRARVDGTPTTLKEQGRLAISCKRKGAGYSLRIRTRKRGRSLRSVVGDHLALGVYNPLDAKGSPRVRFTFRR